MRRWEEEGIFENAFSIVSMVFIFKNRFQRESNLELLRSRLLPGVFVVVITLFLDYMMDFFLGGGRGDVRNAAFFSRFD